MRRRYVSYTYELCSYEVLAVGFRLTETADAESWMSETELRLEPVLYFLPEADAEEKSGEPTYWSGAQLLNFVLGEREWQWNQAESCSSPPDCPIRSVPSEIINFYGDSFREGSSFLSSSLIFTRSVEAAAAAHATLAFFASIRREPVITLATRYYESNVFDYSADGDVFEWTEGGSAEADACESWTYWLKQKAVLKLGRCTTNCSEEVASPSDFANSTGGPRVKFDAAILSQMTAGRSAETEQQLRAEINDARFSRKTPDVIRVQAENDDPTALDRLEIQIIPYGSTDICDDEITLLDLVQNEDYGAEFDCVDSTGKAVATVRFHAVL